MPTALGRACDYAMANGIELVVIDGPALGGYGTVRSGSLTILSISSGTVESPEFGDIVYLACEAIAAAQQLSINIHHPARRLIAS